MLRFADRYRRISRRILPLLLVTMLSQASLAKEAALSQSDGAKLEAEALSILEHHPTEAQHTHAIELLARAAATGLHSAQYYYGAELLTHESSEDRTRGAALLEACARRGSASAQRYLGWFYLRTGDEALQASGLKWVEAAAAQEDPQALLSLGRAYSHGYRSIQRDAGKGVSLLRRATQLGLPQSRGEAAWYLLHATQDASLLERAVYVMQQAAQDNGRMCYLLAREYIFGSAIERDYGKAARWLEKGSHLNAVPNALWLSQLYAKGLGLSRDADRAQQILKTSLGKASSYEQNAFAWDLATSNDAELRDGPLAVQIMERVLAVPANRNPQYTDTLAAAYAEIGNFERAIRTQREAIAMSAGRSDVSDVLKQHLDLFTSAKPVREAH